jgi:hypothetical protein
LRFAYNHTGLYTSGGESKHWILRHIEQLKPLLRKNIGQIAVVQAGFIGAWGEWHTSPLQKDQEAKNDIVTALLDALPASCFIEMRTPALVNALTLPGKDYSGRIGFNNDYFTAGGHSHAPGNDFVPGDAWYLQVKQMSPYTYISGEIPYNEQSEWGLSFLINTDTTLQILRDHHYSALDITQNFELNITSWKHVRVYPALLERLHILFSPDYFRDAGGKVVARSFYDFVRDHLGYRLDLLDSSVIRTEGDDFLFDLKLVNTGFATVINPRLVYLVFIDGNDRVVKEVPLDVSPKDWQPFDVTAQTHRPVIHEIKGRLSAGLSGKYKVGIWMPEPGNNKYDGRYDIRLATGKIVRHWRDADDRYIVNIIGNVSF